MNATASSWKTPIALVITGLALFLATLKIDPRRSSPAEPQAVTAPSRPDGEPISNEVGDFQQLD